MSEASEKVVPINKTFELGVLDRIVLMQVLPAEGDIITMRVLRDFRKELSFTEDEIREREIVQQDGMMKWNDKGEKRTFTVSSAVLGVIRDAFKRLNEQKKITDQMLPVYDIFE